MFSRFFMGFGFVLDGKRLFFEVPGVKKWVAIPLLIAIALLISGVTIAADQVQILVQKTILFMLGTPGDFLYKLLYYPLLIIFSLVFVVLYVYAVYVSTSLISSPFYAIIAEKTLVYLKVIQPQPFSIAKTLKTAVRMFLVSLMRSVLLVVIGVALFIFSFVPGVNLAAAYTAFVILAVDSADYSFEGQTLGLRERFRYVKNHLPEFAGMGGFIGLTVLMPGLILLIMPFAVIGSAGLVHKIKLSESTGV